MTPTLARTIVALNNDIPHDRSYRAGHLCQNLNTPPGTLARAARLLGWHQIKVRVTRGRKRPLTTYWTPPGVRPPKRRKRGRPSYYDYL
jgi:hypothetical protein